MNFRISSLFILKTLYFMSFVTMIMFSSAILITGYRTYVDHNAITMLISALLFFTFITFLKVFHAICNEIKRRERKILLTK